MQPLFYTVKPETAAPLIQEWAWLVHEAHTPLLLSVFGDWIFGAPDGSIWALTTLDGDYFKIAADSNQFNALLRSSQWLDETFMAEWQEIALRHGLSPAEGECVGWKIHPAIGGKFEKENLQLFSMRVYQSLMAQFHLQLKTRPDLQ